MREVRCSTGVPSVIISKLHEKGEQRGEERLMIHRFNTNN